MGFFQFVDPAEGVGEFTLSCGRNSPNTVNLWLRDANGTPLNLAPFVVPFNCDLVAMSASTRDAHTCDFDVYRQPEVRAGGIPDAIDRIARISLAAANENIDTTLSVPLLAGDGIGIFARGAGITFPRVTIWLVRT